MSEEKKTSKITPFISKVTNEVFYPCTSCEEQCRGHGGGEPLYNGGCLCNDGVLLECLM